MFQIKTLFIDEEDAIDIVVAQMVFGICIVKQTKTILKDSEKLLKI